MATYLTLKNLVANLMGNTDGATDTGNEVRNNMILSARRGIFDRYNFSWLLKTADLSVTSGTADMPSDYNPGLILKDARIVNSSANDDYILQQIKIEDRDKYSTDSTADYVCWITWDSTNDIYVFNTNQTTETVVIWYYHLPADLSANTDVEVCPDPEAIAYKAASLTYLADERDETNSDRLNAIAEQKIGELITRDRLASPMPTIKDVLDEYDMGFNAPTDAKPATGYKVN